MFGEDALWYYKRGVARVTLGRPAEADRDFAKTLSLDGRNWVHGRAQLELGKLSLKAGQRAAARQHLESAIALCDGDNDAASADEARRLLLK